VATGLEVSTLDGHSEIFSVAFSPDGQTLASLSVDETVSLWDVASLHMASVQKVRRLPGHFSGLYEIGPALSFSPNGLILASGSRDGTVRLWDVASGRELWSLKGHSNLVTSLSFSPDGRTVASGSLDTTVRLWNVASGREMACLVSPSPKDCLS